MSRASERQAIRDGLAALPVFQAVYRSEQRSLGGQSPVVTMSSLQLAPQHITRGMIAHRYGYQITIWVVAEGDLEAVEDQLDAATAAAVDWLLTNGYTIEPSTKEPFGTILNDIDGVDYRAERFLARRAEYGA